MPDRLHSAAASVGQVTDGGFTVAGAGATTCQGDAGGAALREAAGQVQLVGLRGRTGQGGCLGETGADSTASEIRADRFADWIRQHVTVPGQLPELSRNLARGATFTASSSAEIWGWLLVDINDGVRGPQAGRRTRRRPRRTRNGWSSPSPVERHQPVTRIDLYPRIDRQVAQNNFPANLIVEAWNGTAWEPGGVPGEPATPAVRAEVLVPGSSASKLRIAGTGR